MNQRQTAVGRLLCATLLVLASRAFAASLPTVSPTPTPGSIPLVANGQACDIYVDPTDNALTQKAAELLADDVQRVTNIRPKVVHDAAQLTTHAILIGTLGRSALIDHLAAAHQINVTKIANQWESDQITVVNHPLPNVDSALVIAGSDRRGTAYGVFDLSKAIGVSPWYWWADVTPLHRESLYVSPQTIDQGPPKVKYRGIFINDEDWGLEPWAAHTFDPKFGNIGPKTYEKVFELLLRLRGNFLWPAMHPCSTEFGKIPENIKLADQWGIVMGASHTEAMNRNNVDWPTLHRGPWNYQTNRQNMLAYWQQWAQQRGPYEAVWTMGLRGVHDSPMQGPKDTQGKVNLVEQAITDQRNLLAQYVNPDVTKVPQAFTPYKEVLALYRAGLKVPDDITLIWPEDNYGYIRQLSTPAEQQRPGSSGVYYHISYLGSPFSYVWLNTTPPALIWEEMTKAYANGANRLWVLNVGDIKPGEIGIDFWLKLAWNPDVWTAKTQAIYLRDWAQETFGPTHAADIANIMQQYFLLGFQRKPESLTSNVFSLDHYGEAQQRLSAYDNLLAQARSIDNQIPPPLKDAYYELVLYPVMMCKDANALFIEDDLSHANTPDANRAATLAAAQLHEMEQGTAHYNDQIAHGKWKQMMTLGGTSARSWKIKWPKLSTETAKLSPPNAPIAAASAKPPESGWRFTEQDGVVSIAAAHFTHNHPTPTAHWLPVPGLGRTGNAVTIDPPNAASTDDPTTGPSLEYDFTATTTGPVTLETYCLPTYPLNPQRRLRFAAAIDSAPPQIIDLTNASAGKQWAKNVTENTFIVTTHHTLADSGTHNLHIWMLDPAVVLDKLVLNCGGLKPSYLGPPETPQQ